LREHLGRIIPAALAVLTALLLLFASAGALCMAMFTIMPIGLPMIAQNAV